MGSNLDSIAYKISTLSFLLFTFYIFNGKIYIFLYCVSINELLQL